MKNLTYILFFSFFAAIYTERLVLVGGALADDNELVYGKFVEMATDKNGKQYIGVVTGASAAEDAQANGIFYCDILKKYGASTTEWIPIHLS